MLLVLLGAGGTELVQVQSVLDKQVAGFLQRLLAAVGIINVRWVACRHDPVLLSAHQMGG